MGFDSDQATVYQIRPRHRHEEVLEVVPADYAGVLVNDRGKSHDAGELDGWRQQKCLAHLLRNVSEVVERKCGMARQFGLTLKVLLRESLALWKARPNLSPEQYQVRVQALDDKLTHHLRNRILRDDDNQRLLNGIGGQNDAATCYGSCCKRESHPPTTEPSGFFVPPSSPARSRTARKTSAARRPSPPL
jgi:hypothetical protein